MDTYWHWRWCVHWKRQLHKIFRLPCLSTNSFSTATQLHDWGDMVRGHLQMRKDYPWPNGWSYVFTGNILISVVVGSCPKSSYWSGSGSLRLSKRLYVMKCLGNPRSRNINIFLYVYIYVIIHFCMHDMRLTCKRHALSPQRLTGPTSMTSLRLWKPATEPFPSFHENNHNSSVGPSFRHIHSECDLSTTIH